MEELQICFGEFVTWTPVPGERSLSMVHGLTALLWLGIEIIGLVGTQCFSLSILKCFFF